MVRLRLVLPHPLSPALGSGLTVLANEGNDRMNREKEEVSERGERDGGRSDASSPSTNQAPDNHKVSGSCSKGTPFEVMNGGASGC